MTERQSIERRGERYIAYQKHVSCFFVFLTVTRSVTYGYD